MWDDNTTQGDWELIVGGLVDERFTTHAEAIEEASRRVRLRHAFGLAPQTYGVYKRHDN
jgi:hypothetical protein